MKRIGLIGKRALAQVHGLRSITGVDITVVCELDEGVKAEAAELGVPGFTSKFEEALDQVDAVVIGTPMHLHATQSIDAMAAGKAVLCEVTAAVEIDECRRLAEASGLYFFAENYCYFEENLVALTLAQQGRFGELYYGEGDYVHEVRFLHKTPSGEPSWRTQWQVGRRGNTYCTHEIGPLMRMFRAQDPAIRITSVACFGTGVHTVPGSVHDDNTLTMVQLSNGGLIKLRLDMVSNRPHLIRYELQGVNGCYESGQGHRYWFGENRGLDWDKSEHRDWRGIDEFRDALPPDIRQEIEDARQYGHGGGDYMVGRRFAQALTGLRDVEIGKFEAVEWTMVGLLSQQSIVNGSVPVPMPPWVYA